MIELYGVVVVVAGCLFAYAVAGLLFARSQAVSLYRSAAEEHRRRWPRLAPDLYIPGEVRAKLVTLAVFWPFALVGLLVTRLFRHLFGGRDLLMGPVEERQAKAAQLRADADTWAEQALTEDDPAKRTMARELARMLREQAQEVDL